MKKYYLFFIILFYFVFISNSCKKDSKEVEKGDVEILVQYQTLPEIPNGAEVYSDPPGISGYVDASGTLLIRDVPVGTYEVYGYVAGYGGGKTAVSVLSGQLAGGLVVLIPGYDPGKAPVLDEFLPAENSKFSPSDTIPFSIKVHSQGEAATSLSVKVESDADGILFNGNPDNAGYVVFKKRLSKNEHTLSITVTNSDEFTIHVQRHIDVTLPERIFLNTPVVNGGQISLNWTAYTGNDFKSYQVFRVKDTDGPELLSTISNSATTVYTDTDTPIVDSVTYYVSVLNLDDLSASSNTQSLKYPMGFILNQEIFACCIDESEHCIYVLCKYDLVKYYYLTNTLIEKSNGNMYFQVNNDCSMEIADNGFGKELYINSPGYNSVWIYNTTDLSLNKELEFSSDIMSCSTNGGGYLYLLTKYENYEQTVFTCKRSTYQIVDSEVLTDDWISVIKCIPGQNAIACLAWNWTNFKKIYYDNSGHLSTFLFQPNSEVLMDWQIKPYHFSPNGQYFLSGIQGRLYTTDDNLTYQDRDLTSDIYNDMAISPNNIDLYSVWSYHKMVSKYKYPQLSYSGSIETKGFPYFIETDGPNLIILSRSYPSIEDSYLVEVISSKK